MDYSMRLQGVKNLLKELNFEALIIEDPTNLLYLTGLELSTGKLLISAQAVLLVVDGRYDEKARTQIVYPVLLLEKFSLKEWLSEHQIHSLGFDADKTSYQSYLNLLSLTQEINLSLISSASPLNPLRLIKDTNEIQLLRHAATLAQKGCRNVIESLREGVSEEELAFELEFFWKKRGAKKLSFDPIIAFGKNSSIPHYRAGSTILEKGMNVLIDIGVAFQNYHSDMTRLVYFGKPDPRIQKIYGIVEEAKLKAMELCRPGTLVGDLDHCARDFITKEGYGAYFTHSLGHGLGLDVHEAPIVRSKGVHSQLPLQEGMVITIEPGIYLPGIGGVRLEDTLLITKQGYENLTA